MPEQIVDRKKLCALFEKVARHVEMHERGNDPITTSFQYSLGQVLRENRDTGSIEILANCDPKRPNTQIISLERDIPFLFGDDNEDLEIKISKTNGELARFEIVTAIVGARTEDLLANNVVYYNAEKDGKITKAKATNLVFVFAQVMSQISSLNADNIMALLEGPDVDDAKARRMTYEDRAAAIAETLVL